MPAERERFAELFKAPTVEAMHALASGKEFERFVAYVLQRAGYDAKVVGPHFLRGVDVEMRMRGSACIVGGVECKRYQADSLVTASVVRGVRGAPAVGGAAAKPYVFTTSDFTDDAHKMANAKGKHAHLLNGSQLVRYINYVRGSRHDDQNVIACISPEFFAGREY